EPAAAGDADCSSERILVAVLLAFGNEPRRGIEQRDLRREEIAEEPRDAPGDINPRTTHGGAWQNLDTGDAAGGAVPNGAAAHERKTLGDLLAAGSERCAPPQVDHECARHLAVGLEIEADHLACGEAAKLHCGRRGQKARVGSEQIAPGGHYVAAATLRRASGAWRHALAVERSDKSLALGVGACLPLRVGGLGKDATIDVQPVLDGEVLEIAQPGIDLAQGFVGMEVAFGAGLACQAAVSRGVDNELGEALAPPAVEPVGD